MRILLPLWETAAARAAQTADAPGELSGTWLVVAPERKQFRDLAERCARAMAGRGAMVDTLMVDCGAISCDVLAGLLEYAQEGEPLAGVVSLLGLDEAPLPDRPAAPEGRSGTFGLIQALGDAGVEAPLWVLTREALGMAPAGQPPHQPPHGATARTREPGRVMDLEHPGRWGVLAEDPGEFGERAAALLCAVLADRDEGLAATWSAEADRQGFQAVDERAAPPAQRRRVHR